MSSEPKTLQEAILYFADPDNCVSYLVARRWPNGVMCPTCGRKDVAYVAARRVWQCKSRHPKAQFSVKVGTIMEDSALGLDKWLTAIWMQTSMKNGVSSWEIHRSLGITQKCAWHMLHRIRLALQDPKSGGKLSGEVEVNETYIGGKARNMHKDVRKRRIEHERGMAGKAIVMGLLERKGRVRTHVIDTSRRKILHEKVREHVEAGAQVFTDSHKAYLGLNEYEHKVIDHAKAYVEGNVHTNGLENFWSLLKRGLGGTYVSVEPFHLFRYVDEQAFRFNTRKDDEGNAISDAERFSIAVSRITGKRLTYAELIGSPDKAKLN